MDIPASHTYQTLINQKLVNNIFKFKVSFIFQHDFNVIILNTIILII